MKTQYLLLAFFLFFNTSIFSQDLIERTKLDLPFKEEGVKENQLYKLIQSAKINGVALSQEQGLFSITSSPINQINSELLALEDVVFLQLNNANLQAVRSNRPTYLALKIPVADKKIIELELFEATLRNTNYSAQTSQGSFAPSEPIFYRGIVKGIPNSLVAITLFPDGIRGLIMATDGNYTFAKMNGSDTYALYNDHKLSTPPFVNCDVEDDNTESESTVIDNQFQNQNLTTADTVNIYVECDYDMYQKFGTKVAVENFVLGLFNEIATIYQNEMIPITVSNILVWETTDPYASTAANTSALLNAFRATRKTFDGAFALLFSTRAQVGGRAGVNRWCDNAAHGMCLLTETSYQPYPTYSNWVNVTTHEMGHLFGSPHTHNCSWGPNNNAAIDDCAPTEGGCGLVVSPTPSAEKGTIMSYCHTVSGGMFSLSKGFGTEPGNLIRNRFANANCRVNCSHLPTPLTAVAAANCTPQTNPTYLNGGYGGLMSMTIGNNIVASSYTAADEAFWGGGGFIDFKSNCYKTFVLDENATYSVSLETWFNNHNVKAWIDYNNNNQFDEPSELLFSISTNNRVNNLTSGTGSFTVAAAPTLNTFLKLRFIGDLSTVSGPCHNPTYGQCEDYAVYIKGANTCLSNNTITDNPATGTYRATQTISTSGTVEIVGTASFIAGNSITLNQNFHAKTGSNFLAKIDVNPCNTFRGNSEGIALFKANKNDTQKYVEANISELKIMPNPLTNETSFLFDLEDAAEVNIQIYDLSGQLLDQVTQNQWMAQGLNKITYNAQKLPTGMFYVVLKAGRQLQSKKMVVIDF